LREKISGIKVVNTLPLEFNKPNVPERSHS
jgi:hypothetical protein